MNSAMAPAATLTAASRCRGPVPAPAGGGLAGSRGSGLLGAAGRGSRRTLSVATRSEKPGIGDGLLDMLQGGPKLRRWYGEEELLGVGGQAGEEGEQGPEQQLSDDAPRDTVLVLDAESPMGEQVRLLVNDAAAAKAAFGPYVETVQGATNVLRADPSALKGVKAIIVPGRVGVAAQVAKLAGVEHIVLLSSVGSKAGGGFGLFASGELQMLSGEEREAEVKSCGVPFTIARVGRIKDVPAGPKAITLTQDQAPSNDVSRESVAAVLANSAAFQPAIGRVFTVSLRDNSDGPESWPELFEGLSEEQRASA